MKYNKTDFSLGFFLACAGIIGLLCLVLFDNNTHNQIRSIYYLWLMGWIMLFSVHSFIFKRVKILITHPDILILLYFAYMTVNYVFVSQVDASTRYMNTTYLIMLYFSFRILLTTYPNIINVLFIVFIVCGLIEATWGMAQWIGLIHLGKEFPITGTFTNPGPYGGYLSVVIAICASFMIRYSNKIKRNIWLYALCGITSLVAFFILVVILNRAALVALIICVGICLFNYHKFRRKIEYFFMANKKRAVGLCIFFLLVITSVSFVAYEQKKDSVTGRLFVWRISCIMINRNPIFGCGYGSFSGTYARTQADFFHLYPESQAKHAADAPKFCFNEYLQSGVEMGLIGLFLLLSIFLITVCRLVKTNNTFGYGLITLLIFAFFSYPLCIPALQIPAIIFIAIGAGFFGEKKKGVGVLPMYICLLSLCVYLTVHYAKRINAVKTWNQTSILYQLGYYDQVCSDYSKLCPQLLDHPRFLFEYGYALNQIKQFAHSNAILQEGAQISCDPMFFNITGNNFKELGDMVHAEKAYLYAFNMLPNRILPLYLLMKLYVDFKQEEKARAFAQKVINFRPKIDSPAVRDMKKEAMEVKKSTFSK